MTKAWLNGTILASAQAALPATDHGVLLGDGLFETFLVRNGGVRDLNLHLDRLRTSCERMGIALPDDDPARIARAVDFSRFERVQAQEQAAGFGEKMPLAGSFFRKGQVGSWREGMSDELAAKLIADHRVVLRRFGYGENGWIT